MRILKILFIATVVLFLQNHPDGKITLQFTEGGPAYIRPFVQDIGYSGAEETRVARRGSTVEIDVLDGGSPQEWARFFVSLTT